MKYKDRQGRIVSANEAQDQFLQKLYQSVWGRRLLHLFIQPAVSRLAGKALDTKLSKMAIPGFVKRNAIDLSEFEKEEFDSYNDFFTRKLRPGIRSFPPDAQSMGAPCDSKLSIYPITRGAEFCIKDTKYTMESLTRSKKIASHYRGGYLMVFRLTVDDYHHYCFVDDGVTTRNYHIPGVYHTVNPVAGEHYPIYKENTRCFSILRSKQFGRILMMEVGALLVGRICNFKEKALVKRGEEKGMFEFGGSTVILAVEPGRLIPDSDILRNTQEGYETIVKMGETIGRKR